MMTTNADDARPATQQEQQSNDGSIDAVVSPPVLYSSHPPTDLVNSWNETRQARATLDQCREEKEFVEQQLSAEQDKARRLERHCSELEGDNATLRAQLAAFELENHLPPGWERIFSSSQQRFFYSHAATQTTQWHYPTASEVKDPAIAKLRVDHNTQDAHSRRLS